MRNAKFNSHVRRLRQLLALIAILGISLTVEPALAHGGGRTLHMDNAPAGPFHLSVWTSPEIRRAGEIHVEIQVVNEDGAVDTNCLVWVRLIPLDQDGPGWTQLAPPAHGGTEMEAVFRLDQPGRYAVEVEVTGLDAAGRSAGGQVGFSLDVVPVTPLLQGLLIGQMLATVAAGLWFAEQGRRLWLNLGRAPSVEQVPA
jgi:hypothetical protein